MEGTSIAKNGETPFFYIFSSTQRYCIILSSHCPGISHPFTPEQTDFGRLLRGAEKYLMRIKLAKFIRIGLVTCYEDGKIESG